MPARTTKKNATAKAATEKPTTQAEKAPLAVDGPLRVTVKRDGFRRVGRAWSGATTVEAGELSEQQVATLRADPMFVVEAAE